MSILRLFVLCAVLATAGGCTTTGDPSQGGLLNWSEKKAQQRQDELAGAAEQARTEADNAQQQVSEARLTLSEEEAVLKSQQRRLDSLLKEHYDLQLRFNELSKSERVKSAEYDRLRAQQLSLPDDPRQHFLDLRSLGDKQTYLEQINDANNQTAEAIKMLMRF